MKYLLVVVLAVLAITFNVTDKLSAQDNIGGSVKYQKIKKFNFRTGRNQRWNDFVASLPKEGKYSYVLYFTNDFALYTNNPEDQEEYSPELQRALHFQSMFNPPKPELKKIYYDFEAKKKIEEVDFMTRTFLIESDIETKSWKLISKPKKINDHICMGAEMTDGEDIIRAWFASDIPVSTGPENFYGLPGLILLIEINGEMSVVATSINLDIPDKELVQKPSEGKKISQKKFDKLVEEKTEEHKKNMQNRGRGRMGPH